MTIDDYIKKLTLPEKAVLLQGQTAWTTWPVPRLGIPAIFLADGPHGLRKQKGSADHLGLNPSVPATCFPTAAAMANSWDPDLGQELGKALGAEAAANDVHVVLGPGLNIKRSPLCGRNFEYFSEDPYLAGKMAAGYIRGIQENGIAACPKHFAANSQELRRMSTDSVVDERTLREIYLTGFEIAVKEGGAKAIMSAYNPVNGVYANENPHLLREILRDEWGFGGFVVSDWGACNDPVAGAAAGAALNMPNPGLDNARELYQAVLDGKLPESVLDDRLRELLPVVFSAAQAVAEAPKQYDGDAHHALARKCAAGSIVLLENDGILPLKEGAKVAIMGKFGEEPRIQGAGSSMVNPTRVEKLTDVLAPVAPEDADVIVLCVGLDDETECEGQDRTHLNLTQNQLDFMTSVTKKYKNVVLVLTGGSPFILPRGNYRAVIHGYLSGQAGAAAMADVLYGRINPSGKLAETWPEALADTPCHGYYPGQSRTAQYREGPYVGYRYYDTVNLPVRYPFGHGLSYTTFAYSDLEADSRQVRFTLTNTGSRDGAEVAQVYISCRTGQIYRPKKELKGFQKVFLKAGESRRVTIALDDKAFRYFNVKTNGWEIETANYEIMVAAGAADIRLSTTVRLFGTDAPLPDASLPGYESGCIRNVPDREFAALLGRPVPEDRWDKEIGMNDPLCRFEQAKNPAARLIFRFLHQKIQKNTGTPDLNYLFVMNMPIRAFAQMTGGTISREMTADFVYWVNGHFWRGLGRLIRGFFRARKQDADFRRLLEDGPVE